jgi:hypothetical protein
MKNIMHIPLVLSSDEFSILLYQLRKETTKGESRKHQQACKKLQNKLAKILG